MVITQLVFSYVLTIPLSLQVSVLDYVQLS